MFHRWILSNEADDGKKRLDAGSEGTVDVSVDIGRNPPVAMLPGVVMALVFKGRARLASYSTSFLSGRRFYLSPSSFSSFGL